jgi:hypothetical protein
MSKRYGLLNFIGDIFLTAITGGLWLVYKVFRALR